MRIIVAEDDKRLGELLKRGLSNDGFSVDVVESAIKMIDLAKTSSYDVIVLDVMMPKMDGFEACKRLRQRGVWTPVLMLTARAAVADRIEGFEAGADDYLPKPFSLSELKMRLRALARRGNAPSDADVVCVNGIKLDSSRHIVSREDTPIELTPTEFSILEALMQNAGMIVSRDSLLDLAWDEGFEAQSNIVNVYIKRLRIKVDKPFGVQSIETVRGVGYRLRTDRC